ncbi:MAG: tetratricopeptide repeat protein [Bacteroidetes bacterium]|nr:tetratricopeptide repeat protein [Bacteroidota bacterium]
MKLNKTQIAVVSGALLLIVLLLLANTKLLPKEEAPVAEHEHSETADFTKMVQSAIDALGASEKKAVQSLDEAIKTSPDKKLAFENMINMWDSLRNPSVAAYYMELASQASPTEVNWFEAASRYYAATRFVEETNRPLLYNKAIECYNHVLEMNPKNVDAKISLAACYVEGSPDPMKGIGMLREIEKTDSTNVNLQLNFAFFSERSGQWEKAIARFEKVLKFQPDYIEAYLHLADAYIQMGDKTKAIESLKKYVALVDDVTIKTEVQDYINKLTTEETHGHTQ